MSVSDKQFHMLMRAALTGSDVAARKLFEDYEPVLLNAIRRKLNKKVRSKFDSIDIAQDVWASFFAEPAEKRVFKTSKELLAFLTKLARNKAIDAMRQNISLHKYGFQREQSLDDSRRINKEELAGNQATPSQIMMTQEEWSEFLGKQPLVYRRIFIKVREGSSHREIARELGLHVRTVDRVVAKLGS